MRIQTPKDIGLIIYTTRKKQKITQEQLAMISGVGLRFIRELERGKPTAQLEKSLDVLISLGLKLNIQGG